MGRMQNQTMLHYKENQGSVLYIDNYWVINTLSRSIDRMHHLSAMVDYIFMMLVYRSMYSMSGLYVI